jgi:hypothetical protein
VDTGSWRYDSSSKIGQKLKEVKHSNTKYIKEDCYLTTSIEYSSKTLKVLTKMRISGILKRKIMTLIKFLKTNIHTHAVIPMPNLLMD